MKHIFIIIAFFLIPGFAFSQQPPFAEEKKKDEPSFLKDRDTNDSRLRITIALLDAVSFPPDYNCQVKGTFLFKVKHISTGYYKHECIWVKCGISKRDMDFWHSGFWWVLVKTKETILGFPVYGHSGNF
jgi:hypothetical protein